MNSEEWTTRHLVELSGGYWKACALQAGVKLRAFTVLGDDALSGADAARAMGVSERGGAMLLNALAAMGLLVKREDRFANTPSSRRLLCEDSEAYAGHILMHHHHLMGSWARLPEAVAAGAPVRERSSHADDQTRESFLMGMFNLASELAPRVVPLIDLSGRKRLLDLGGGPGTYAIHFCLHNPDLEAAVFDLPSTRPSRRRPSRVSASRGGSNSFRGTTSRMKYPAASTRHGSPTSSTRRAPRAVGRSSVKPPMRSIREASS
jgi:hypothetical protein